LEETQDHRVVERVVEEDVLSQSPFLLESHLLCEGEARLVLSIGPPTCPMKVQLFEGLFQEETDYFSPVSLSSTVFLSYRQSIVCTCVPFISVLVCFRS